VTSFMSICVNRGDAVAAPVEVCYASDTAAVSATPSWSVTAPDTPVLTVRDFAELERFARLGLRPNDPVSAALLAKLDRSTIFPVDAIASNVATLGSRVIFSVDGGPPEARVLVLPARHSPAGWTLLVTTPHGLALLGHAPGALVSATRRDGAAETLRLLAVADQPEAAAAEAVRGSGDAEPAAARQTAPPADQRAAAY
jgi:regulator of nucleoside diphosphate kinase